MWQRLHTELEAKGLTVITVALDSEPGAPEPWIERAEVTYPALIDREHRVAELYNMVNVPQAVWIDEDGRIVRPPEPAGSFDALSSRITQPGADPTEVQSRARETRLAYIRAIHDWVERGSQSEYIYSDDQALARLDLPGEDVALAHASFRLGRHLIASGRDEEGRAHLEQAMQLHPDSWAMWRQASAKLENGIAAGPEFTARVRDRALANQPYYAPIDMPGLPASPKPDAT